ncbi:MAG: hypothetical protein DKINENOH_03937 [bacterium]|nr:hypothetical protein [bacterium]
MLALLEQHRAFELAIGINGDGVVARADLRARRQPRNVIEALGAVRLQLMPGFQQFMRLHPAIHPRRPARDRGVEIIQLHLRIENRGKQSLSRSE